MTIREQSAQFTLDHEARRDVKGRLKVYPLPAGDGGGAWEVAGVCVRYHPKVAEELKRLIAEGRHSEAEAAARRYYAEYTDAVGRWPIPDAVEFFLRDTAFNRGVGGAGTILQYAVGANPDGQVGPATGKAVMTYLEKQTEKSLLMDLRAACERYERVNVGRGPSSKFWKGLVSRWDQRLKAALTHAL